MDKIPVAANETVVIPFGWNAASPLQAVSRIVRSGPVEDGQPTVELGDTSTLTLRDINGAPIVVLKMRAGDPQWELAIPNVTPGYLRVTIG